MVTSNGPILVPEIVTPGAAHDFRVNADDPDYRVRTKAGGSWQWAAWRPEGVRVAVSSDWFPSAGAARDAARRVRRPAGTAIGP